MKSMSLLHKINTRRWYIYSERVNV